MCDSGVLWKRVMWEPGPFFGGCPDVFVSWVPCGYLFASVFFLGWSFSPEKNPLVTGHCVKTTDQLWGKRPEGLTFHFLPCFEHSSSVPRSSQAWGSFEVVRLPR